jgi:hypothetical protein
MRPFWAREAAAIWTFVSFPPGPDASFDATRLGGAAWPNRLRLAILGSGQ